MAYPALEEGFGLPALEALACGAPLITTEGTAMAEMAQDAACLVPPGDDAALADALGSALEQGKWADPTWRGGGRRGWRGRRNSPGPPAWTSMSAPFRWPSVPRSRVH